MNKYIFVVGVAVILYLSYSNYNLRQNKKPECNTSEIVKLNTDYELSVHKHFNKQSSDSSLIADLYDSNLQETKLEGKKIILRIPSNVCNPCYDEIYNLILDNYSTFIRNNLRILVDVETLREYQQYFGDLGMGNMLIGIKNEFKVGGGLEDQAFPYFFRYNATQNKYDFPFLVNKSSLQRIKRYFEVMSQKDFS